jgi:hypothetical protein
MGGQVMNSLQTFLRRIVRPLGSRKIRVALATVVAAYFVDAGLEVGEEVVLAVIGTGVAIILGIAHEDAGRSG